MLPAGADCRRVVRVQHVAAIVEVAPVVAAVFTPVPVAVPAYSVGYADHAGIQQLAQEVQLLRQQLQQMQTQAQAQPQKLPATAEHPGSVFLKKSCVACHDASVAKAKGGGQIFFNAGNLMNLSAEQKLAIAAAVYSGRMPKGGKATDEDVGALISYFDQPAATVAMPPAK